MRWLVALLLVIFVFGARWCYLTEPALSDPIEIGFRSPEVEPSNDWPQFWGPSRNNVSSEQGLVDEWGIDGPDELWRVEVGTGYSSPVVAAGKVVVLHRKNDSELISCWNAADGEPIWEHRYPTTFECRYRYSNGPYSTPLIADGRVFAVGAQGQFHCLDLETGKVIWLRELHKDYQVKEALFAVGASPWMEKDRIIFNLGAADAQAGIIALDANDGTTVWATTEYHASYATPVGHTIHHERYVFVVTFEGLVALDPDNGKVFWAEPFRPRSPDTVNATSPVVHGDQVLMVTGPGPGSLCVRVLPGRKHEIAWKSRRVLDSQFNSLITIDDFVFGYSSRRYGRTSFRCVDLKTGELKWKWVSDLERGSAIAADGKFILWGEFGHLALMDVSNQAPLLRAITREPLLSKPCYSAPALSQGRLYLRNETTLLCLNLREPQAPSAVSLKKR